MVNSEIRTKTQNVSTKGEGFMAQKTYYLIDSAKGLQTITKLKPSEVTKVVSGETQRPTVAMSESAMKKAIASGWW